MPILNYTTKVNVYTTLGEIQGQLVAHGAKKVITAQAVGQRWMGKGD